MKAHFMFIKFFFFPPENCAIYELLLQNMVDKPDMSQMTM